MERNWRDERIAELEGQLAVRDARIAELEQQVEKLSAQVAELLGRLGQNSRNSHRPPSSDPPAARQQRKGKKGKSKGQRKRGGQPGHRGVHRQLVPAERVDEFVQLFPSVCGNCWSSLPEVPDALAQRYQQIELPPLSPHVKEWQRHAVACPGCGHSTRAAYDERKIPASPFGPRLMALMALLTGVYHLSRRKATQLLGDVVGVRVSLGALSAVEARVSGAVEPAVDEIWSQVLDAPVKHTDGTSWFQSGLSLTLWTIATATATVFKIVTDGSKKSIRFTEPCSETARRVARCLA